MAGQSHVGVAVVMVVTVGIDVVMVGRHESRSGLCWVHFLQLKGWAGVPALQRLQLKGASEVSGLVVKQSLQMKG